MEELEERTFEEYEPVVEWSHAAADADTVTISLPGKEKLTSRALASINSPLVPVISS